MDTGDEVEQQFNLKYSIQRVSGPNMTRPVDSDGSTVGSWLGANEDSRDILLAADRLGGLVCDDLRGNLDSR